MWDYYYNICSGWDKCVANKINDNHQEKSVLLSNSCKLNGWDYKDVKWKLKTVLDGFLKKIGVKLSNTSNITRWYVYGYFDYALSQIKDKYKNEKVIYEALEYLSKKFRCWYNRLIWANNDNDTISKLDKILNWFLWNNSTDNREKELKGFVLYMLEKWMKKEVLRKYISDYPYIPQNDREILLSILDELDSDNISNVSSKVSKVLSSIDNNTAASRNRSNSNNNVSNNNGCVYNGLWFKNGDIVPVTRDNYVDKLMVNNYITNFKVTKYVKDFKDAILAKPYWWKCVNWKFVCPSGYVPMKASIPGTIAIDEIDVCVKKNYTCYYNWKYYPVWSSVAYSKKDYYPFGWNFYSVFFTKSLVCNPFLPEGYELKVSMENNARKEYNTTLTIKKNALKTYLSLNSYDDYKSIFWIKYFGKDGTIVYENNNDMCKLHAWWWYPEVISKWEHVVLFKPWHSYFKIICKWWRRYRAPNPFKWCEKWYVVNSKNSYMCTRNSKDKVCKLDSWRNPIYLPEWIYIVRNKPKHAYFKVVCKWDKWSLVSNNSFVWCQEWYVISSKNAYMCTKK